ncbi:MAG: PfkB family carbohydrate kinase [Bradyrhizobium sp.]|nr:PfkB family carbohydrate kinase [Bradyrhizobium sp.]
MTHDLTIVGGIYVERCIQPLWDAVYGSAGRAAHAVRNLIPGRIILHSYVAPEMKAQAEHVASDCDATLMPTSAKHNLSFSYLHPMSVPAIFPTPRHIEAHVPISVKGDVVLRFGMLEGDAIVEANVAVYDPQSAFDVALFQANGSRARRLAVVMNRHETEQMTGQSDPSLAAKDLIAKGLAEVVIIKMGSSGAMVTTGVGQSVTPAYRSTHVWKLGSGDVFSGTFAALWGCQGMDAAQAADHASRAVALYCDTRSLPVPGVSDLQALSYDPVVPTKGTVYLAAPFFDLAQRWLVEETRDQLRALGASVFSPLHQVGPGPASIVGPEDIKGLEKSDAVFAILNGLDAGTIFEVGYAVKKGIPVVCFAQNVSVESLKMVEGTGCEVVDDFVSALYRTIWRLPKA